MDHHHHHISLAAKKQLLQDWVYVQKYYQPKTPSEALSNSALVRTISAVLEGGICNVQNDKVLLATSCCVDEVNQDLNNALHGAFGRPFTMGGLAGFPFVGKTGFEAYMAHVPKDGLMLLICSSHVGIDCNGVAGVLNRLDRSGNPAERKSGTCGAAIAAYGLCHTYKGHLHEVGHGAFCPDPITDHQQNYIARTVSKFHKIEGQEDLFDGTTPERMVRLAELVAQQIYRDVNLLIPPVLNCRFAILNGVQINFEGKHSTMDFFHPIAFDLYENDQPVQDLLPGFWKQHHAHPDPDLLP